MPNCCAFGCSNKGSDGKRLFLIPSRQRDTERRKVWLQRIGRADFKPTLASRLCEDHFTEDQFEPQILEQHGIKKLKASATPSIFSHNKPPQQHKPPARREAPLRSQGQSGGPQASKKSGRPLPSGPDKPQGRKRIRKRNAQQDKLKKRPRPVKILAEDPSDIYLDDVPESAAPSKTTHKGIAATKNGLGGQPKPAPSKRRVKVLAFNPPEISPGVSPVQKQPNVAVKKHYKVKFVSAKEQLNSFSSLPASQMMRLISSIYCNHCDLQFTTLKRLDEHYWAYHSHLDLPLDLGFEVGTGDVAPTATLCAACAKLTVCADNLTRLLREAASDGET